jgi:hypothetical protein
LTGAASLNVLKAGDTMTGTLAIVPAAGNAITTTGNVAITGAATGNALSVTGAATASSSIARIIGSNNQAALQVTGNGSGAGILISGNTGSGRGIDVSTSTGTGSAIVAVGSASSPAATITAGANQPALTVSDGTAAVPSIAFNSQNNMGLYRIGSDSLGISTAGTNRMIVDTNGARYTSNYRVNAYLGFNGTLSVASLIIPFNIKNFDPGNNYDTTTGLYTVPVAGVYFVSAAADIVSNLTAIKSLELVVNGVSVDGYSTSQTVSNSQRGALNFAGLISLAAGDTLGVRYNGRVGEVLRESDTHVNIHLMSI